MSNRPPLRLGRLRQMVAWSRRLALPFLLLALVACQSESTSTPTPFPLASPSPVLSNPSPIVPETSSAPLAVASPTLGAYVPRFMGGSIVVAGVGSPGREVTALPPFIANALYDSLLQVDPQNGALLPGLADSFQASADARTLTFHLRADLTWQDGQPLTAQDVVWTIKTLSNSASRLAPVADFGPMADVTALDPQTVVITLSQPYCPALTYIGTMKILPAHILKDKDLSALTDQEFIGSGPLVLKSWTANTITLARNPAYWKGPASIDSWIYKIVATDAEARAALAAGQVDLWVSDAVHNTADTNATGVNVMTYPANRFYALAMSREQSVLGDAQVRQAIALSLDRQELAQTLWGKAGLPLATSLLPTFWATPPDLVVTPSDLAQARQLLAAAGWSDTNGDGVLDKAGKPLRLSLWAIADDSVDEPLAFLVRARLAQIGIQALVQLDDRDALLTRALLHEYDLALVPWNIPLDPDQHWYWQSTENIKGQGLNVTSYANPQVDDLVSRGQQAPACDTTTRRAVYNDLYRTVAGDIPQVVLLSPPVQLFARARVRGLVPSSFAGPYWNINRWEVAP
ncbi:MAG: ABC transporter substrate-binding protein [Anaerolineae bacterium]